jgi:cell wall assembly regulator SMI1
MPSIDLVLATISDVPSLAPLLDERAPVFTIPADARAYPLVFCSSDNADAVRAALSKAKIAALRLYEDELDGVAPALAGELGALSRQAVAALEHGGQRFSTESAFVTHASTLAAVEAALTKASLSHARLSSFVEPRPQWSEEEAIERIVQGAEYVSAQWIEPMKAHLRGERTLSLAEYERDCKDLGASACGALGPAIEQWNPAVADRALRLFLQEKSRDSLWLRGDDAPPALGIDRESKLVAMLLRAGASEPLALQIAASSVEGPHTLTRALVARPATLQAAFDEAPSRAFALTADMGLWKHGFEPSPTWTAHVAGLLASHHPALGASFLYEMSKSFASKIDRAHIEHAARFDTTDAEKLQWAAAQLEEGDGRRHAGLLSFALETWAKHVAPAQYGRAIESMLRNEKRPLVFDAVWLSFVTMLERNPSDPFEDSSGYYTFVYNIAKLRSPPKPVAARLGAWLAANPKVLGASLTKSLAKKAGTAPAKKPAPYNNDDLQGIDPTLAKAIEAARKKSWEAEIKLPKGASEATIAEVEKSLGHALPDDVREFYRRHDGAGDDECFNSCRLLSIREAAAQRALLKEYEAGGARAFDASWLPLTDDGAGNHHCVVLSGKNAGQVMDFDHESGAGRKVVARFAALLQKARWGE